MKALWELFSTFFKIGICTFGGGYAMLPMLEREIVKGHGWATVSYTHLTLPTILLV